jgi:hypothetical protein
MYPEHQTLNSHERPGDFDVHDAWSRLAHLLWYPHVLPVHYHGTDDVHVYSHHRPSHCAWCRRPRTAVLAPSMHHHLGNRTVHAVQLRVQRD